MASRPPPRRPNARPAQPAPKRGPPQKPPLRLKGEAPDAAGDQTVKEDAVAGAGDQTVMEDAVAGPGDRTVMEDAIEDEMSKTVAEDAVEKTVVLEDELALQPVHEEAPSAQKQEKIRYNKPIARGGNTHESADTSRLLLLAAIVVVAIIGCGAYVFFSETPPSIGTGKTEPAVPDKPVEKKKKEEAHDYTLNSANRAAYIAYATFMRWAQAEALDYNDAKLTARMNRNVSLQGVDDPDLKEVVKLTQDSFHIGGERALMRLSGEELTPTGPHGKATFDASERSAKMKALYRQIGAISNKLIQRYGAAPESTTKPLE